MMQRLLLFNPDNDLALGNNSSHYQPPETVKRMSADLASLPFWWARDGDVILTPLPDMEGLWDKQMPLRQDISWKDDVSLEGFEGDVCPWGWNITLRNKLLGRGVSLESLPTEDRLESIRQVSSRKRAVEVLHDMIPSPWTCGRSICIRSLEELKEALDALSMAGTESRFMLKAPWSGSGKGLRRSSRKPDDVVLNWCRRVLHIQQAVVVEPLYDRAADFAMEFYADGAEGVSFVGYSLFHSDSNGVYRGNRLVSDEEIVRTLSRYIPPKILDEVRCFLEIRLVSLLQGRYKGYLGVDMMICCFKDEPHYRLHPCVEINLRMNMGILSHTLYNRWILRGSNGWFHIDYFRNPLALMSDHQKRKNAHPLVIEDGRIKEGYLSLTPLTEESCYRAYIEVVSG